MTSTWGEHWLLDTAVRGRISLRSLVHPALTQFFNKPGHHLGPPALCALLERLVERGDLALRTRARGAHHPPREALLRALVYDHDTRPTDGLCYGLTAQGGRRWEDATHADWSRFLSNSYAPDPTAPLGEITGPDRARVERCLEGTDRPVLAETVRWDRLEPWQATYWKTLPVGHRVRFRYGPERPLRCGAPLPRSWYLDHAQWFTPPTFERGALYAVPLDSNRWGIARVLELQAERRFVVACDWTGPRGEIPPNLATLGRTFARSEPHGLLGGWVPGPVPSGWVFEGAIEVTEPETRLARATQRTGTWTEFVRRNSL